MSNYDQKREYFGGQDGDVWTYDAAQNKWGPAAPSGGGGGGSGDITGVTVQSPLTGGGTSGGVTIGLGTVPVNKGGTGATDAATARTNLGAAAATHTHAAGDVTSGTFDPDRLGTGTRDGTKFLRDDGTWQAASGGGGGSGLPLYSAPNFSSFSWVNQGTATRQQVERVSGGHPFELLSAPQAAETNLRMLMQNMPATPYTVEIGVYRCTTEANWSRCGIAVYDSSSGRVVAAGLNGAARWAIQKYNSPTSHNSDYNAQTAFHASVANLIFFRMVDTGTNFEWSYSPDGFVWIPMNTQSRTNWLAAPDQVGVFFSARNNTGGGDHFVVPHWRVY